MKYSIAIDGPAGSGKSTIAQLIAEQLGFEYLNSGSIYRALALFIIDHKLSISEIDNFKWIKDVQIKSEKQNIFLNSIDVTKLIRSPECAQLASKIALLPPLRDFVNHLIIAISDTTNIVVDGRDIGSIVLPHAQLKIYLDASVKIRAERIIRHNMALNIKNKNFIQVLEEVQERDQRDKMRLIAPLTRASDAVYLDTSNLTKNQVIEKIKQLWVEKIIHD